MSRFRNIPGWRFVSIVLVLGACGTRAGGADQAEVIDSLRKELAGRDRQQAAPAAPPQAGDTTAHEQPAESVVIMPPAQPDTVNLEHGALLDVWLNNREGDLKVLTTGRSIGSAVVTKELFRYNQVTTDPDLREFWGKPLLLKWSGLLEINESGTYVFVFDLSKEQTEESYDALSVKTQGAIDSRIVFEASSSRPQLLAISETDSRELSLAKGFHTLEIWLAVSPGRWSLQPDTRLGTYLKIRRPHAMTAEPLQPSQIWHRIR